MVATPERRKTKSRPAGRMKPKKQQPDPWDEPDHDEFEDDWDEPTAPIRRPSSRRGKAKKSTSRLRPSKKGRKSAGGGLELGFDASRINIFLIVIGGLMLFGGIQETRLSMKSSSTPQEISLSKLVTDDSTNNVYFKVTGCEGGVGDGGYVAEERGDRVLQAFFPVVPIDGVRGRDFIIRGRALKTRAAVEALMNQTTFTGMVINDIETLDRKTKELLATIPGVNPDNALIFEVGRTPSSGLKFLMFYGGGLALLGFGVYRLLFLRGSS